jgi:O-antigen/teichoic acid export membrane protein
VDQSPATEFRSRFFVGVVSTSVGTLVPTVFSFVGVLLVLRWLDEADYGVYMLLMVLVQLVATVSEFGLRTAIVHSLQHETDPERRRQTVNSAMIATAMFVVMASVVTLAVQEVIFRVYDYELLRSLLWSFPFLLAATNLNNTAQGVLQAEHLYKPLMTIRILAAVARLGLVVLFVGMLRDGVWGLVYAEVITGAAALAVTLRVTPTRTLFELERGRLTQLLRFGFALYLNQLLSFTFNRVDVMMIGHMTNAQSVAACEVAERIPNNLKAVLSSSFMTVFFPNVSRLLARGEKERARALVDMSLRVLSFGIMGIALVVAMLQNEIVVLLFSEKYIETGPAVSIFMLALALGMAGTVMGMTLVAAGHSSGPLRINLVAVASNVGGNLILIPWLGFTGAAVATFVMMAVTLPVNQWYLGRKVFHVDGIGYLLPVVLGLLLVGVRHWAHVDAVGARLLLLLLFALGCPLLLAPLRRDLVKVYNSGIIVAQQQRARP